MFDFSIVIPVCFNAGSLHLVEDELRKSVNAHGRIEWQDCFCG